MIHHGYHKWAACESAVMDSCCVVLRANTPVAKASKGGFNNGDTEFWGERIRGSFNNIWVNQFAKSLKVDKSVNKFTPGVAFAVLTSNNGKETVVS